jgi:hypothetical protein
MFTTEELATIVTIPECSYSFAVKAVAFLEPKFALLFG